MTAWQSLNIEYEERPLGIWSREEIETAVVESGREKRRRLRRQERNTCFIVGEEAAEMAAMYINGATLKQVSDHFHHAPTTTTSTLVKLGVAIRGARSDYTRKGR